VLGFPPPALEGESPQSREDSKVVLTSKPRPPPKESSDVIVGFPVPATGMRIFPFDGASERSEFPHRHQVSLSPLELLPLFLGVEKAVIESQCIATLFWVERP